MSNVIVTPYLSPTLVLLAMDWEDGFKRNDFLGFAIKRTPGFRSQEGKRTAESSWLPNRIGFNGPNPKGADMPSNTNPVQHFQWWDARIDTVDRGKTFTYEVFPVIGPWNNLSLLTANRATVECKIPQTVEHGIGTYFNRAVVSSQAFAREFGKAPKGEKYHQALAWLSNGMNEAVTNFITNAKNTGLAGAAYHLTDGEWIIPELQGYDADASFVYFFKPPSKNGKGGDNANASVLKTLRSKTNIKFKKRTKTNIMHDKFIVDSKSDTLSDATSVLMGTANFTTEGLTQQANVIHTFESPELAKLYLARQILLRGDPTVGNTAKGAKWSPLLTVGDAKIRVFFAPEPNKSRLSIDAVVNAVKNAKSSVLFSLFSATDEALLDACKSVADNGKLMRGLVNMINEKGDPAKGDDGTKNASQVAATWLFERSQDDNMVVGHASFGQNQTPSGFWQESNTLVNPDAPKPKSKGGKKSRIPPVYVHQKIVIVDGDTKSPLIFVGSANLSKNSTWHNDENMLEISQCPRLGKTYVAEFMRLYEQYRARFSWNKAHPQLTAAGAKATKTKHARKATAMPVTSNRSDTFSLTKDTSWAAKDYKPGTMEYISRKAFAGE